MSRQHERRVLTLLHPGVDQYVALAVAVDDDDRISSVRAGSTEVIGFYATRREAQAGAISALSMGYYVGVAVLQVTDTFQLKRVKDDAFV